MDLSLILGRILNDDCGSWFTKSSKSKSCKGHFSKKQVLMKLSIVNVDAPSGVNAMPFSDNETMKGAINRAEYCIGNHEVDIAIGLEGGVMETPSGLFLCNWGALAENGKTTLLAGWG